MTAAYGTFDLGDSTDGNYRSDGKGWDFPDTGGNSGQDFTAVGYLESVETRTVTADTGEY